MKEMHSLLRRQLKKFFRGTEPLPEVMNDFVDAINDAYYEFDTDREMLERALDLSSQELIHANAGMRAIFLALPDTLFKVNRDGVILDCTASRADEPSFSARAMMIGKRIQDIPSKETGNRFDEALRQVRESHSIVNVEYELSVEGREYFYEARMVPFLEDQAIIIVRNITERKRMEEEITRERSRLKTIWDNAPFGMALVDRDGRFTYINPKFTELLGFALTDIPDGRTWFRKAFPNTEYRHTVISKWIEDWRNAKPGTSLPAVFTATCRDGTQKTVNFINSILDSGEYLVACEDITELKHLESQLWQAQKMEAMGTLAGGVAHDFNNILTALVGYAALLRMETGNETSRTYVDHIFSASQKATDLVRSLLAFSKQQNISLKPINLHDIILGTEKLLKRLLTEDITIKTLLAPEEITIMADATQIDQILFNLTANARDAMPQGGTLTIETRAVELDEEFRRTHGYGEPGRYAVLAISDTGVGIDETERGRIFDPFFTTKEVGKGTGLGLSTVYGIVKQHNGYINVYSEPRRGTTFHIYLPATSEADREEQPARPLVRGGKETILIAEDNEAVRGLISKVLSQYGYRTIEAIDGLDAVVQFRKAAGIDLLIVDSVMPGMNGREAYNKIESLRPDIRVIFTSGYTRDVVLDKGVEDGKFNFLQKPISPQILLQKVRAVLDGEALQ